MKTEGWKENCGVEKNSCGMVAWNLLGKKTYDSNFCYNEEQYPSASKHRLSEKRIREELWK